MTFNQLDTYIQANFYLDDAWPAIKQAVINDTLDHCLDDITGSDLIELIDCIMFTYNYKV